MVSRRQRSAAARLGIGRRVRYFASMQAEESPGPIPSEVRWHFGPFTVWEAQRRLERDGKPVRVGPRSFDLLLALLGRAGDFVGKDELLSLVWTGVVVEEGSVRVHMSTLRRALGAPRESDGCKEWISNVPLRGYRFNGRARREVDHAGSESDRPSAVSFTKLPIRLTQLVGRGRDVANILSALDLHRLVTIVGTGGIGKTSVAIRAAECRQARERTETAFVDLSPLISQDHVMGTLARSLGAAADRPDTVQAIVERLEGRDVLLLIDNCEHVMDSLALPINDLLRALPNLRILATSREPLLLAGEYVVRLSALAVPDTEELLLGQAMRWPAVELFVERAAAAGARQLDDSVGPLVSRIARQLDGVPLAIELVAARLGVQTIGDLALRLDDHLRLYSNGNRAILPRHRTLAAALDWSIALLSADELRLLRRLSVFRGRFHVESAIGVAPDMDPDAAFDALISLANKSLVVFDGTDAIAPYRLLETTRSYAAELLGRTDEHAEVLRRHVGSMLELMTTATAELNDLAEQAWTERYAYRLDDVRFALDVCLVRYPDAGIAAQLVSASAPFWFHASQVAEYRDWIAAALALADQQPDPDVERVTWLNTALISALLHAGGSISDLSTACDRALAGAQTLGIRGLELQARWGHCTHEMFRGEYAIALQRAQELHAVARSWDDPVALNLSHRVMAMATHFCGNLDTSHRHSESAIRLAGGTGRVRTQMVGVDPIVAAKAMLCRTLWLQGETTYALEAAADAVARARAAGSYVSLCAGLYGACPVALWSGEQGLAHEWVHMMVDEAKRRGLMGWYRFADCYLQGLKLSDAEDPGLHIRAVSEQLGSYGEQQREMLITFCVDWLDDEMVTRVSRGAGQWSASEVWRAAGARSERRGRPDEAEAFYARALDTSRQQGALGWELRAAMSMARMWGQSGRTQEAARLLAATCERAPVDGRNAALSQALELLARLPSR